MPEVEEGDLERLLAAGFSDADADLILDSKVPTPLALDWASLFPDDSAEAICRTASLGCFNDYCEMERALDWRKAGLSPEQAEEWDRIVGWIITLRDGDLSILREFFRPHLLAAMVGSNDEYELSLEETVACARRLLAHRPHLSEEELINWIGRLQPLTRWNNFHCVSKWLLSPLSEEACLKGIVFMQEDEVDDYVFIEFIEDLMRTRGEDELFREIDAMTELYLSIHDSRDGHYCSGAGEDTISWWKERNVPVEAIERCKEAGITLHLLYDFSTEFPDEPIDICVGYLQVAADHGEDAFEWRRAGFALSEFEEWVSVDDFWDAAGATALREAGITARLAQECAAAHNDAAYQSGYWFDGEQRIDAIIGFYRVLGADRMVDGITTAVRMSLCPEDALEWFEEMSLDLAQGFMVFECTDPGVAADWLSRGFSPAMAAAACKDYGWIAPSYLEALIGKSPERPSFDFSEEWQSRGFSYEQAAVWWASGFDAESAASFQAEGLDAEKAIHLQLCPSGSAHLVIDPMLMSRTLGS